MTRNNRTKEKLFCENNSCSFLDCTQCVFTRSLERKFKELHDAMDAIPKVLLLNYTDYSRYLESVTTSGVVTDVDIVRNTFKVYGSIFGAMLFLFCYLRRRAPHHYNVRSWIPGLSCDLAQDQFGFISWIWKVYPISDDEILKQCGLDALCFLRVLTLGLKISCIGIFNSMYLLPLYANAERSKETAEVIDFFSIMSASNVPSGNKRLLGTVIGAYILFGCTMYLILKELEWFTQMRHQFLQQRISRNYGVYVSGIPEEYRSSHTLLDYFRDCFSKEGVLEAHVAMDIPILESKIAHRDALVVKLERAIVVERLKRNTTIPSHHYSSVTKIDVHSVRENTVERYKDELLALNDDINKSIHTITIINHRFRNNLERARALSVIEHDISPDEIDEPVKRKRTWSRDFIRRYSADYDPSFRQLSRINNSTDVRLCPFVEYEDDHESVGIPDDLAELGITELHQALEVNNQELGSAFTDENGHETYLQYESTELHHFPSDIVDSTTEANTDRLATDGEISILPVSGELEKSLHEWQNRLGQRSCDHLSQESSLISEFDACSPVLMREIAQQETREHRTEQSNLALMGESDRILQFTTHTSANKKQEALLTTFAEGENQLSQLSTLEPLQEVTIHPTKRDQDRTCIMSSRFEFENSSVSCKSVNTTVSNSKHGDDSCNNNPMIASSAQIKPESPLEVVGTAQNSNAKERSIPRIVVSTITRETGKVFMAGKNSVRKAVKIGKNEVKYAMKEGEQQIKNVIKEVNAENLVKVGVLGVDSVRNATSAGVHTLKKAASAGKQVVNSTLAFIMRNGDGRPRDAGFVAFTKLSTAHAALQMIHHPSPYVMHVQEAPDPDDIYWGNVGMHHRVRFFGNLLSLGLSGVLCLFWTIPTTFISSLTSVSSLKESLPFLDTWINRAPWLAQVLAQLAPLMLYILTLCLSTILGEFAKLEGHIASSALEASRFMKLSAFTIIQTFFVSAISGGITAQLNNMIKHPKAIVDLLANSLPAQSIFFVQIILVSTFIGQSLELLRVGPISKAWLRSRLGQNLTETEKNTTYFHLRPLSDPNSFQHAEVFAQTMLYFLVIFVYATIAPLTCYFAAFCFLILSCGFRHQFIFNYPTKPDSGGKLWIGFIGLSLTCMLIAQITLAGMLALKKATYATPAMVPLMIMTIIFNFYIREETFCVTNHLPTRECLRVDKMHHTNGEKDYTFLLGKYLQPALQSRYVFPESWSGPHSPRASAACGNSEMY